MQSIVRAENLALSATRGPVYGPLSFDINGPDTGRNLGAHPGTAANNSSALTVLAGPAGSGRTSLLLTLAGRMKPSHGELSVLGHTLPRHARAVQKATAIAGFHDIDVLEETVSVGAAIRERQAWLAPWWSLIPRADDATVRRVCLPAFGAPGEAGATAIPTAATLIYDLTETQAALLRVALALMSAPQLLFFDQVEQLQSPDARATLWARLDALSRGARNRPALAVVASVAAPDRAIWRELRLDPAVIDLSESRSESTRESTPESTRDSGADTATDNTLNLELELA